MTRDEWDLGGADECTISLGMGLGDFAVVASVDDEPQAVAEVGASEPEPQVAASISAATPESIGGAVPSATSVTEGTAVGPPRPRRTPSTSSPAVMRSAGLPADEVESDETTEVSPLPLAPETPNGGSAAVAASPEEYLAESAAASALQLTARAAASRAWDEEVAERGEAHGRNAPPEDLDSFGGGATPESAPAPDTADVYEPESTLVAEEEIFDDSDIYEGEIIGESAAYDAVDDYDPENDITDVELTLADIEMADTIHGIEAPFNPELMASFGRNRLAEPVAAQSELREAEADLVEAAMAAAERASSDWDVVADEAPEVEARSLTEALAAAMEIEPEDATASGAQLRMPPPPKMKNVRRNRMLALAAMLLLPISGIAGYLIVDGNKPVESDIVEIPAPAEAPLLAPEDGDEGDPEEQGALDEANGIDVAMAPEAGPALAAEAVHSAVASARSSAGGDVDATGEDDGGAASDGDDSDGDGLPVVEAPRPE